MLVQDFRIVTTNGPFPEKPSARVVELFLGIVLTSPPDPQANPGAS